MVWRHKDVFVDIIMSSYILLVAIVYSNGIWILNWLNLNS